MHWQMATGIASIIIAVCALVISIWQGIIIRRHNRISVRPHLTTWTHELHDKGIYQIDLINNGIGPAFIETFEVKVDGKTIAGEGTEPIKKAIEILFSKGLFPYNSVQSYVSKGYAMAPKERLRIATIQFLGPKFPSSEAIEHALNRASLVVRYKSAYDEQFVLNTEKAEK